MSNNIHQIINTDNRNVIGGFTTVLPALPQFPAARAYSPLVPATTVAGFNVPAQNVITNDKYLSQEFDLIGHPSDTFKYTAGAYFFDEKGTNQITPSEQTVALDFGAPFAAIPGQGPIGLINFGNGTASKAHNTSWALFGQFTWTPDILSKKLDITPGLRYTRDTRDAALANNGSTTVFYAPNGISAPVSGLLFPGATQAVPAGYIVIPGAPIVAASSGSLTFSKTSPSLTLTYHLDDDKMIYGKIVKGYRSGGFNASASSAALFTRGYAPETLTSTELGFKGEFFEHRLRTNFALFQSKYDNQQITVAKTYISTSTYDVTNAGKSTYTGYEFDVMAAVTDALKLSFNLSHVTFKYDQVLDQGLDGTTADVTRFYHILPSRNSYSLSADYSFGKVGPGKLDGNLNYTYTSENSTGATDVYTIAGGVATLLQTINMNNRLTPGFGLLNGRLAWSGIQVGPGNKGDLTVALWGKNLSDKRSPGFVIDPAVSLFIGAASPWIAPRTYGIDLIYRYQ
ncbi:MAG TPA: TonB-dependent receptor [Rhodocyclaceae bacterium]|nr:TonB-dependent receptor [Rhodocyclaceae bacterium]